MTTSPEEQVGKWDHETVEERFGGSIGRFDEAETEFRNASYTELEPGAEEEVLVSGVMAAHRVEEAMIDVRTDLEKAREKVRSLPSKAEAPDAS